MSRPKTFPVGSYFSQVRLLTITVGFRASADFNGLRETDQIADGMPVNRV